MATLLLLFVRELYFPLLLLLLDFVGESAKVTSLLLLLLLLFDLGEENEGTGGFGENTLLLLSELFILHSDELRLIEFFEFARANAAPDPVRNNKFLCESFFSEKATEASPKMGRVD